MVFRRGEFSGKRCGSCGLVYLTPRVEHLEAIYQDDITSSPTTYYEHARSSDVKTFTKRVALLEDHAMRGALLDVGCNVGTFLEVAYGRGWKTVQGVEPNGHAAAACRSKQIPVRNEFFTARLADEFEGAFDAVYLGDVIEHVTDPNELARAVRRVLRPGGVVMVVTPNYASFVARRLQIKPLEHILYFTSGSLRTLLERAGFEVVRAETTTRYRSIPSLVHSTTFQSSGAKVMLRMLTALRLDSLINLTLQWFVRDEVLVIARAR